MKTESVKLINMPLNRYITQCPHCLIPEVLYSQGFGEVTNWALVDKIYTRFQCPHCKHMSLIQEQLPPRIKQPKRKKQTTLPF